MAKPLEFEEVSGTAESISVSARAAKKIATLIAAEERGDLKLRVTVSGGGCSGFQYGFDFDPEQKADDIAIEKDGVTVLVDTTSAAYMAGSEIDYVEDLIGSSFRINNPNAVAACGCGTSFSLA